MPARRVAAQKAIASKAYYDYDLPSDYEATPSLSSADGDHDGSSDFAPETPTKGDVKPELYASDDDMKPDLASDDDDMPGGENEGEEEDWDSYGKKQGGKKRKVGAGGGSKTASPAKKKRASASGNGASPAKLGAPWDGTEDWALFVCLHPKVSKPDWKSVAQVVGRDAKSCQNRYATFGKRLEAAIKGGSAK